MTEMEKENSLTNSNLEIESFNKELADSINENISHSLDNVELIQLIKFSAAVILLILFIKLAFWIISKIENLLFKKEKVFSSVKYKDLVLVESRTIHQIIGFIFGLIKAVSAVFVFYSFLTYVLSIFPKTQGIAETLVKYLGRMSISFIKSSLNFIPNILTITFIIVITYYLLQFIKFIARSLFAQKISFSGFKREWIIPTYKISQFFLVIFAVIAAFPYLPGSGSPAFQGVSVFVGLLITLGSSTAIANTIAGIVLIYMTPYGVGDRVKIDNIIGDITEIGLLVTRLRTIKNEEVTIPNSKILSKETINYTDSTQNKKTLLLHIDITIGYDVAWRKVEELLLNSAKSIEGSSNEEEAFVLLKQLENNYISYELNLPIQDASKMIQIKSELNKNILDNFNKAGIEILSPAYYSRRDGSSSTIVKEDA